ncbi:hypothetical protein VN97_g9480 [Penicillium thymicola]|uniref:Uncharacterized protein n=1 Tax=Penicillium thymicola TaxID=293382 RepID=A0AAI9TBC3_PENTH|nr:hypothetical protein VN97_g9480 [Penicillium thymicola]
MKRITCLINNLICGPLVLPLHFPSFLGLALATFSIFAQISSRIRLNACCDTWLLSALELPRTTWDKLRAPASPQVLYGPPTHQTQLSVHHSHHSEGLYLVGNTLE